MLTGLNIYNAQGSSPLLGFSSSGIGSDPLQIRDIKGLGPVNADVNTVANGLYNGEKLVGSFVGKRNIVLTVGLNPNWEDQTMTSLRKLLYFYFMTQTNLVLEFESTDYPKVNIEGTVESCEPNIFSQDPEVQVSIICPDPDFVAVTPTVVTGTVNDGSETTDIDYPGSVSTGMIVRVLSNTDVPTYTGPLRIYIPSAFNPVTFMVNPITINASSYLRMCSIPGRKSVQSVSTSSGIGTDRLSSVEIGSKWPQLGPGVTPLSVFIYDIASIGQSWELTYWARFGGL